MMARSVFARRSRRRWTEIAFWLAVVVSIVVFPTHLILITQLLIVGLFAASFDLLVGYTGIASLGHAAFFGIGAYAAGILIHAGWTEPISGLAVAGIAAGAFGLVVSALVAQLSGPALLMITLGLNLLVFEAAHTAKWLTGGDDGLAGVVPSPVLGLFAFDLYGRTAVVYTLVGGASCTRRSACSSKVSARMRGALRRWGYRFARARWRRSPCRPFWRGSPAHCSRRSRRRWRSACSASTGRRRC